jgi:hypothetical protein
MTMPRNLTSLVLVLASLALPSVAIAQEDDEGEERQRRVEITPYIEAGQVVSAELSPGDDIATYTRLAAGVDATVNGRNTTAAVSMRYERRVGWQDGDPDGDIVTGIGRASVGLVPQALTLEAGAMAARTRVDGNGSAITSPIVDNLGESNIYAAYGGPSLHTRAGPVEVNAQYMLGYTRVEEPDALVTAPGVDPVDVFDDSVTHNATVRVGTRPNQALPVGVGVGAGWYREDVSNLDQRVENRYVRGDVTVPLSPSFAVVGGVGYEDVEVSSRDALRDTLGDPVIGADGRFVTDPNSPRVLAYDVEGLIWDAGVIWRPSRRTSLEAHVGRRYGSTTYYGTLSYAPNSRTTFNVGVYDSVSGFGGMVTRVLDELPTDFVAQRNPLTGDLGLCVVSMNSGSCLGGALGAIRSSTFRSRGVAANLAFDTGRTTFGLGAGYDRRKFIAATGTVLAPSNGMNDESLWAMAYFNGQIDERSSFSAGAYGNWFQSGFDLAGETTAFGATVAYNRELVRRLEATAAASIDTVSQEELLEDIWSAAAMLGLRYSF